MVARVGYAGHKTKRIIGLNLIKVIGA